MNDVRREDHRTVAVPTELYEQAKRAALKAGWKSLEALVAARLRAYVEYGDFANAGGPAKAADGGWTPVPI